MYSIANDSIKKIEVLNGDGVQVSVIEIDVSNSAIIEQFAGLIRGLDEMNAEYRKESSTVMEKHKNDGMEDVQEGEVSLDMVVDYGRLRVKYIERCMGEINAIFGKDTIQNFCHDNYGRNPDYVPDEMQLVSFVEKMIPVMDELFKQRFDENRKKYSPAKRGSIGAKRRHYG